MKRQKHNHKRRNCNTFNKWQSVRTCPALVPAAQTPVVLPPRCPSPHQCCPPQLQQPRAASWSLCWPCMHHKDWPYCCCCCWVFGQRGQRLPCREPPASGQRSHKHPCSRNKCNNYSKSLPTSLPLLLKVAPWRKLMLAAIAIPKAELCGRARPPLQQWKQSCVAAAQLPGRPPHGTGHSMEAAPRQYLASCKPKAPHINLLYLKGLPALS